MARVHRLGAPGSRCRPRIDSRQIAHVSDLVLHIALRRARRTLAAVVSPRGHARPHLTLPAPWRELASPGQLPIERRRPSPARTLLPCRQRHPRSPSRRPFHAGRLGIPLRRALGPAALPLHGRRHGRRWPRRPPLGTAAAKRIKDHELPAGPRPPDDRDPAVLDGHDAPGDYAAALRAYRGPSELADRAKLLLGVTDRPPS